MNSLLHTACATCINQDGNKDVVAANGAVFVMIGALSIVFFGIMAVLYAFIRRQRRVADSTVNTKI